MNTKALYWMALGVFALALNSEYQKGGLPLAHRVADRAEAVYCQAAARAQQSLAMARLMYSQATTDVPTDEFLARQQAAVDRALAERQVELNRELALRQADLARMQQDMGRVRVVMDRAQVQKLSKLRSFKFDFNDGRGRKTIAICPETGAKIAVDVDQDSVDVGDIDVDVQ